MAAHRLVPRIYNTIVLQQERVTPWLGAIKSLLYKNRTPARDLHPMPSAWIVATAETEPTILEFGNPFSCEVLGVVRVLDRGRLSSDHTDRGKHGLIEVSGFTIDPDLANQEEIRMELLMSLLQYLAEQQDDRPVVTRLPMGLRWSPLTNLFLKAMMTPLDSPVISMEHGSAQLYLGSRKDIREAYVLAGLMEQELRRSVRLKFF